jgi:hypothetical protein
MNEKGSRSFPDQSVDEAGEIVDLGLWVDEFEWYFDDALLREIEVTLEAGLERAPYILISCAIDFLVTFWAGAASTRERYRDFVNAFFVGYDGDQLYTELRCRMVHNYTVGENTIICWGEPDIHGCTTSNGEMVLNVEQFFLDFVQAKEKHFAALRASGQLLDNHISRFDEIGVLSSMDAEHVRRRISPG